MWLMVCHWPQSQEGGGRDPISFLQVSTTWVLTCLETVHQTPCMTREIETLLSDRRVGNKSVLEHRADDQSSLHYSATE